MSTQLEQLVAEVQQDETLMAEFQQITDPDVLVARSVEIAHERGYDTVTEAEVRSFMDQTRKAPLSSAELDTVGGAGTKSVTFCLSC